MTQRTLTAPWLLAVLLLLVTPAFATEPDATREAAMAKWRQSLATTEVYLLKNDTPYFMEMIPELTKAVNSWLDAIAKRDINGIMTFVLMESRDSVEKALHDPSHDLYQYLFSDNWLPYRLSKSPTRDFVLVRKGTKWRPLSGIQACIFERSQYNPQTDAEYADIYRKQADGTLCEYFFYGDDHWRFGVSSFFEERGL